MLYPIQKGPGYRHLRIRSPNGSLGAPLTSNQLDVQQVSTALAPFLSALAAKPATEQVEVLKARIKNYAAIRDAVPEPLRTLYSNQIGVMQARLRAAQHAKQLEREAEQAVKAWRVLGYTVTGTGIVTGAAIIAVLMSVSDYYQRKGHGKKHGRGGKHRSSDDE